MSADAQAATAEWTTTGLRWPGYLLGFGLGGFFDGILLHQILQWHHLLSLVEGVGDLRSQVIFDGLFHALMYVIAVVGAVMLIRRRAALAQAASSRTLYAAVLIGFGAWHVIDAVLSHWLLGIHRIKLDSPNPLLWDLAWFFIFGVLPLAVGWWLGRSGTGGGHSRLGGHAAAGVILLGVAAGGVWSATANPADAGTAVIVFRPGMTDADVMGAVSGTDGRVLWTARGLWAVTWGDSVPQLALYRNGAFLVGTGFLGAACLAWTEI